MDSIKDWAKGLTRLETKQFQSDGTAQLVAAHKEAVKSAANTPSNNQKQEQGQRDFLVHDISNSQDAGPPPPPPPPGTLTVGTSSSAMHVTVDELFSDQKQVVQDSISTILRNPHFHVSHTSFDTSDCTQLCRRLKPSEHISSTSVTVKPPNVLADIRLHHVGLRDAELKILAAGLICHGKIIVLELTNNYISHKGAAHLADALHHLPSLTSLSLKSNQVGPEGATSVADCLASCSRLTSLNLADNNMADEGVSALLKAVSAPVKVKLYSVGNAPVAYSHRYFPTLDLCDSNLTHRCVDDITSFFSHNASTCTLNLSRNNLGDAGARKLAGLIRKNTSLTDVDLSFNLLSEAGVGIIADVLEVNTTLTVISLGGNAVTQDLGKLHQTFFVEELDISQVEDMRDTVAEEF